MVKPVVAILYNTSTHVVKARIPLIEAIQSAGFDVAVLSPVDETTQTLIEHGVAHYAIEMSQYGMNPLAEIRCMRQIEDIFRQVSPVVSLHYTVKPNVFGTLAAARVRVPVINNIAGAGRIFSAKNPFLRSLAKILFRQALQHSLKVFFQNNDDMRMFLDHNMVSQDQAHRIPGSGVDLRRYRPSPYPRRPTKFLFVGRLLREKGIKEFLDAAQLFSKGETTIFPAEFHIVGEHEDSSLYLKESRLRVAIEDEGVIYHGSVLPKDVGPLISDAHCIVLPSYYGEGIPRVLLEACASGRPIITTDNVGCRDVVDDGVNGYMVPPRDSMALLDAFQQFCRLDEESLKLMSAAARSKAELEFDEAIVIEAYLKALSKFAKR